jgi:HK97 gp10 family phage protein
VAEIQVSFRDKDFKDLADALNRIVPRKHKEGLIEVLDRTLASIEARAKQYVPVRTGHLRSTIQSLKYDELIGAVVAMADYAVFVEFGTRYMRAQPYLRPALFNTLPEINAMLRIVLKEKMDEALR